MTLGAACADADGAADGDVLAGADDDGEADDAGADDAECDLAGGALSTTVVQAARARLRAASPASDDAAIFIIHLPVSRAGQCRYGPKRSFYQACDVVDWPSCWAPSGWWPGISYSQYRRYHSS